MAEPLKNQYNEEFIAILATKLHKVCRGFSKADFVGHIFNDGWEAKELKQRMRHISISIHHCLGDNYKHNIEVLKQIAPEFNYQWTGIFFPDYVEQYGLDDYETSMDALEFFTRFSSSEFAIRPFIICYPRQTMQQILKWSKNKNHHVRRLASEGCRPRLPWANSLSDFKRDPSPVLPILENLKQDNSAYVRKSVANNLNDISKDNAEVVIDLVKKWQGKHPHTDWILKHGCRSLLKQGQQDILTLFDLHPLPLKDVSLCLNSEELSVGETLEFFFSATLPVSAAGKRLRIEYRMDFVNKSGGISQKIFQLSQKELAGSLISFTKRHSFKNLSTRKHYSGKHNLQVIVNGQVVASAPFFLLN